MEWRYLIGQNGNVLEEEAYERTKKEPKGKKQERARVAVMERLWLSWKD